MSIKSEKRDERNRKIWQRTLITLDCLAIIDFIILCVALVNLNTKLCVWAFFILLILCPPIGWMSAGRIKDMENDGMPFWWGV